MIRVRRLEGLLDQSRRRPRPYESNRRQVDERTTNLTEMTLSPMAGEFRFQEFAHEPRSMLEHR